VDVCVLATLEEDVGFVEQDYATPGVGEVEDAVERFFKTERLGAEFANGDLVERAFDEFGDTCGLLDFRICTGTQEGAGLPSAVRVLPVPGGPCRTATRPLPCIASD